MKRVAAALEKTRLTRSRIGKEETLAALFREVGAENDDVALAMAARLSVGLALGVADPRPLGVGWSTMAEICVAECRFPDWMVRACSQACGELAEAWWRLMNRIPEAHQRPGLSLDEVAALFDALAGTGNRALKKEKLEDAFSRATPLETKYLAKAMLHSLRIGAMGGVLEGAVARAFGQPLEEVQRASALVTDPGSLAVLARDGRLRDAQVEIGRPIAFMLATPIEAVASEIVPAMHVVEDKIDGVRAQLHKKGAEISIFARGLERVTEAYPEIVEAFRFVPGSVALDGEIVAVTRDMRPRPFQALQLRLRKRPTEDLLEDVPVAFFAYDLLADDEGDHLREAWSARRARLEAWAELSGPRSSFVLNAVRPMTDLDSEFDAARARGNEGLMLKRVDALYEAGRRGQSWLKVKKAFATLDVVITAAHDGSGKRAGTLSDYSFAVWRGSELVNVGKAYSGLTDDEIDDLTRRLIAATVERFGATRLVRPEIVLEVGFDGIQRSTRHKSGYALRFPRIVRIRDDKTAEQADTVATVEKLFQSQLDTGHREVETAKEREVRVKKPAKKKATNQLSLFGDDSRTKK